METTEQVKETERNGIYQMQRKICSRALMVAVVLAVIFILIEEKAIAKGLLLGTLFSILNFILVGKSVPLALGKARSKASLIGFGSIMARYVVLAIPLVVAIKSVSFSFVAVVVGIFAVQIVTLIEYMVIRPIAERR
jgi:hypothetical protein